MLQTLLYGLVTAMSLIVCHWIWKYCAIRKTLSIVPGPSSLPLIGLSWKIAKTPPKDRLQLLTRICRQFKNGMILIWFGVNPTIIIKTPKYTELVLTNSMLITKSKMYEMAKPGIGHGLAMATGNPWVKRRKLLTPAFHYNLLEDYTEIMRNKTDIFIECLEMELKRNMYSPINIIGWVARYAIDTVVETMMGVNIDCQRKLDNRYVKAVQTYVELSTDRSFYFWLHWDFVYYRTGKGRQFLEAIKTMHQFSESIIGKKQLMRRCELRNSTNNSKVDEHAPIWIFKRQKKNKNLLDLLLDANENTKSQLTLQDIREEVDTFLVAGHEPPATAISWALFALGNAPEVQEKIRAELKSVFGDQTTRISIKLLDQMKYLERVIKEVLRLYTVALFSGRQVENDIVIDGYTIPKGTTLNIDFYQLHHNPEVWDDPEKFDPDRFLPDNIRLKSSYAYVPFSAGPRNCIGQKLGLLQLKTALTAILRKWKISSVLKPADMKMMLGFTLRPHNDRIELYFSPLKY